MGDSKVVLTGGTENMSQAPFAIRNMRFRTKLGVPNQIEDVLWQALTDAHCKTPMGVTAENLAEKYKLTREEVDQFAFNSQQRWKKANDAGYFKQEMAPLRLRLRNKRFRSKWMNTRNHTGAVC